MLDSLQQRHGGGELHPSYYQSGVINLTYDNLNYQAPATGQMTWFFGTSSTRPAVPQLKILPETVGMELQ